MAERGDHGQLKNVFIFFGVTVALGLIFVAAVPRLLGAAAGDDTDVVVQLKRAEKLGLEIPVAGKRLMSSKLSYQRISVHPGEGNTFVVTATLDFVGRFGSTEVSSLGLERIEFEEKDGSLSPKGSLAPRLVAIVEALERRRAALEEARPSALSALGFDAGDHPEWVELQALSKRKLRAEAWFIRSEREQVDVAEDFRLEGVLPDKPIDRRGTKRLLLSPGPQPGQFFFADGLL